jgi:Pentapeptide repeats (8 copies)
MWVSVLIILGYLLTWPWVGVNGTSGTMIVMDIVHGTITATGQSQMKTLWDWLQIAAIPVVVGLGAAWISVKQAQATQDGNDDNQCEEALRDYIDKMSSLILEGKLKSKPKAEVQKVAWLRTLTVLPRLDGARKRRVLHLLYNVGLIDRNNPIIDLSQADLSEADLSRLNLQRAKLNSTDLSRANLRGAILSGADLSNANLSGAYLRGADLSDATLSRANLREATLIGAIFSDAALDGAILSGANLLDAILIGADLRFASLDKARLNGTPLLSIKELEKNAKSLQGATMPDGSKHP